MPQPANLNILGAFSYSLCCKGFNNHFNRNPAITSKAVLSSQLFFEQLATGLYNMVFIEDTLPHMGIVPAIDIILGLCPNIKIVIITAAIDPGTIDLLLSLNCHGIIHHSTVDAVIKQSIPYIYNKGRFICPFIGQVRSNNAPPQSINFLPSYKQAGLSDIENAILIHKIAGKTNNQIAHLRCKSVETIRSHIKHYNKKLLAHNLGHIIDYCNSLEKSHFKNPNKLV